MSLTKRAGRACPACRAAAGRSRAVLGTILKVSTLEGGKADVEIPAGIQPDTVLRLRNKGLPRFGGKGRDDLYPRIKIQIPENTGREERELYERLRALAGKSRRHFWEQARFNRTGNPASLARPLSPSDL